MTHSARPLVASLVATVLALGAVSTAVTVVTASPAIAKSDKARGGPKDGKGPNRRLATDEATASRGGQRGAPEWANRSAKKASDAIDGAFAKLTGQDKKAARRSGGGKPDNGSIKALHAARASDQAYLHASENSRVGRIREWGAALVAEDDARAEYDARMLDLVAGQKAAFGDGLDDAALTDALIRINELDPSDETAYDAEYDAILEGLYADAETKPDYEVLKTAIGDATDAEIAADVADKKAELAVREQITQDALIDASAPNTPPKGDALAAVESWLPHRDILLPPDPAEVLPDDGIVAIEE